MVTWQPRTPKRCMVCTETSISSECGVQGAESAICTVCDYSSCVSHPDHIPMPWHFGEDYNESLKLHDKCKHYN